MKLYIARDKIYNQLFLHTLKPIYRDKVYISNGVCFDPPVDIKEMYNHLKTEDGAIELNFILEK
jgi:hypothetical protein